jgi:hypothetical protein
VACKLTYVFDAIVQQLQTITAGNAPAGGDAYVNSPAVWLVSFFEGSFIPNTLPANKDAFILVRPGLARGKVLQCDLDRRMEVFLLLGSPLKVAVELPWKDSGTRFRQAADLVADVEACLLSNEKLENLADDPKGRVMRIYEDSIVVDYERYHPKWAVAEMRFVAQLRHAKEKRFSE